MIAMTEKKSMSLDTFKDLIINDSEAKDKIIGRADFIDLDNGVMRIYCEHLNKYLEQYCCKDADDLVNTLWYGYGIYCEVKD
jgi:hypothetical protein